MTKPSKKMNCLACQSVSRTNSENEGDLIDITIGLRIILEKDEISAKMEYPKPKYGKMRCASSINVPPDKNIHRRCHSTVAGSVEGQPKLVRSCGMRRDWSFEDLRRHTLKA